MGLLGHWFGESLTRKIAGFLPTEFPLKDVIAGIPLSDTDHHGAPFALTGTVLKQTGWASVAAARLSAPDQLAGEKSAAFTCLHSDVQTPVCGTAQNIVSPFRCFTSAAAAQQRRSADAHATTRAKPTVPFTLNSIAMNREGGNESPAEPIYAVRLPLQ
jgi:hypothetical protein